MIEGVRVSVPGTEMTEVYGGIGKDLKLGMSAWIGTPIVRLGAAIDSGRRV